MPGHPYEQGFDFRLAPEQIALPLRWRRPRRIFLDSMSDLFHKDTPDRYIAGVFGVMAASPQHTYQVLTKRAERLPQWFAWLSEQMRGEFGPAAWCWDRAVEIMPALKHSTWAADFMERCHALPWPLPNVHLGVSAEDQPNADKRIPYLIGAPAALRFLSVEPQLGEVSLERWLCKQETMRSLISGETYRVSSAIGWVICGGESGPGARPFQIAWARKLVEQCRAAKVPVFVKQLGAVPAVACYGEDETDREFALDRQRAVITPDGARWPDRDGQPPVDALVQIRLRNRKGGDMAEWPSDLRVREFPEARDGR